MSKINCTNPNHEDRQASMEAYSDGGFCFSCGWVDKSIKDSSNEKISKVPENVQETIQKIDTYPKEFIRGLHLQVDPGTSDYFILWPNRSYYKRRKYSGSSRYIGPRGVRAPLFLYPGRTEFMVIIEGELNCMSFKHSIFGTETPDYHVCSPGSATELLRHLNDYLTLATRFAIIVDMDKPGVIAGLKLKSELMKRKRKVQLIAVEKDLNEILQEEGKEGIKRWTEKNLVL